MVERRPKDPKPTPAPGFMLLCFSLFLEESWGGHSPVLVVLPHMLCMHTDKKLQQNGLTGQLCSGCFFTYWWWMCWEHKAVVPQNKGAAFRDCTFCILLHQTLPTCRARWAVLTLPTMGNGDPKGSRQSRRCTKANLVFLLESTGVRAIHPLLFAPFLDTNKVLTYVKTQHLSIYHYIAWLTCCLVAAMNVTMHFCIPFMLPALFPDPYHLQSS
jgi:hypothetical protein